VNRVHSADGSYFAFFASLRLGAKERLPKISSREGAKLRKANPGDDLLYRFAIRVNLCPSVANFYFPG